MLDTIGPELQVLNKSEKSIALKAESSVVLTPYQDKEATSDVLPINYDGLAKAVKKGDTIFLGQYLFTGSETTSFWLEICTLPGSGAADMYSNCKQRIYTRICKQCDRYVLRYVSSAAYMYSNFLAYMYSNL
ncbi:pyruvate kinase 2, cytosolic-like [Papaver somniferum]|uniref:pyruvate kinase 2, cytosolic-like n=1 Tax=Papaver somniferum TaxID=3469 RepID=UPI000E700C4C|nr:pyruvate kinase 2, cytosolic-like [Papaver somniferum]